MDFTYTFFPEHHPRLAEWWLTGLPPEWPIEPDQPHADT